MPGPPEWLASCNCSLCLIIICHFHKIEGATTPYVWGDRMISIHHCPSCGSGTHWESTGESYGRVGVNARLLDGFAVSEGRPLFDGEPVEVRFMDNAG